MNWLTILAALLCGIVLGVVGLIGWFMYEWWRNPPW
jgi:F0F1-type ATP synthase assembly protein I